MLLDPQSVSGIHTNIWIQVLPEDISTIVYLPPLSSSSTTQQKNILIAKSLCQPRIHCYHFHFSNMTTVPLFILGHKSLYYLISTTRTSGKQIATNGECPEGGGSMDSQNAFPQFLWTFWVFIGAAVSGRMTHVSYFVQCSVFLQTQCHLCHCQQLHLIQDIIQFVRKSLNSSGWLSYTPTMLSASGSNCLMISKIWLWSKSSLFPVLKIRCGRYSPCDWGSLASSMRQVIVWAQCQALREIVLLQPWSAWWHGIHDMKCSFYSHCVP